MKLMSLSILSLQNTVTILKDIALKILPADDFSRGLASLSGFTGLLGVDSEDGNEGAGSVVVLFPLGVPLAFPLSALGVEFSMLLV